MSTLSGPQAPQTSHITDNLKRQINYMLQVDNNTNALWLAERLLAYDLKSEEAQYLLAKCHARLGNSRSAFEVLKEHARNGKHLGCAYTFAQAAYATGKYNEGIQALERTRNMWASKTTFNPKESGPDAAAVYSLLAKLQIKNKDMKEALACSEAALKLNPFMFETFTNICDTGIQKIHPEHAFRLNAEMETYTKSHPGNPESNVLHSAENSQGSGSGLTAVQAANRPSSRINMQHEDPFSSQPATRGGGGLFGGYRGESTLNSGRPHVNSDIFDSPAGEEMTGIKHTSAINFPTAPSRLRKHPVSVPVPQVPKSARTTAPLFPAKRTHAGYPVQQSQQHDDATGPVRRSQRLNPRETREAQDARRPPTSTRIRTTVTSATGTTSRLGAVSRRQAAPAVAEDDTRATVRRTATAASVPDPVDVKQQKLDDLKHWAALGELMELFRTYGKMYHHVSRYRINEAKDVFSTLPKSHQETPWACALIAKGLYEANLYAQANDYFQRVRGYAPYRMDDMEVFSSVLWHLKKEADLSHLAHDLLEQDWHAPQGWCALGNAWSLTREHEQALKCFTRATLLKPDFAYAYTLQGHENVANEEFSKALTAYHTATTVDPRHYTAYYGMARVYEKQGELDKAFTHYETASMINTSSAVLNCCLGTICEKKKDTERALEYFERAIDLDPKKPLSRFKKSRCLMNLGLFDDALVEMQITKDLAPDEAMVHYLMGKLYRVLKRKSDAVKHYTIAMNLDPKASQQIKDEIEDLDNDDYGMEVSMIVT